MDRLADAIARHRVGVLHLIPSLLDLLLQSSRADRLDTIDVAAITSQVAQFRSALDELAAYMDRDDVDKNEAGMSRYPEISHHAKRYLVASSHLASRVSRQVPFSDAEKIMIAADNEVEVVGSPAAMLLAYNNLAAAFARE